MSRTVTVVTPENITVTYRLAGVASRLMAVLVDLLIMLVLLLLSLLLLGLVNVIAPLGLDHLFNAAFFLGMFAILFVYPTFCEMLSGGRTPGKRLFGLRVIREGGYPINLVSSVIRNVMRFVDFGIVPLSLSNVLLLWGVPGLVSIFFSPGYKRIGDYAGGTLVIVESDISPFTARRPSAALPQGLLYNDQIRNLDRLTVEEYRLIRRFTSRRREMDLVAQAAIGERLARPILQKLELNPPIAYQVQYADLLEAIERAYAEDRGVL